MEKIKKLLKVKHLKIDIKMFSLALALSLIASHIMPTVVMAAEPPGMVEKGLSSLLRGVAWAIQETIIEPSGRPIQTLVFNDGVTSSAQNGIQLLSGNDLSTFMIGMYSVFQLLAAFFFVPMGIVVALDFKRSQDNAQHRAVLKDRLKKLCFTFILITSMPLLLNIIFQFNNVLVDVFNSIGANKIKDASGFMNETHGTMLMDAFKQRAETNKTFLDGALYLMSSVLNLWMLFYYMIRDITIGFLFILFPIVAIFYPFNKNMVITWFREMSSNILTQAIHGGLLCLVIGMSASFGKNPNLYQQLFVMITFGSLIPMTATIKRFLGLEGNVGAAASMSGLGATMGTIALAGGVMKSAKGAYTNVKDGAMDLRNLSAEKKSILKGADGEISKSSGMDKELPVINQTAGLSVPTGDRDKKLQDISARENEARKKIFQGVTGSGAGMLSSGVMAIAGGGLGGKTAVAGAAGGFIAGQTLGAKAGGTGYDAGSSAAYSAVKAGKEYLEKKKFTGAEDRNTIMDLDGNIVGYRELVDEKEGIYHEFDKNREFTGLTTETEIARGEDERQAMRKERILQSQDERLGVNNEVLKSDPKVYRSEKKARQLYDKYTALGQHEKAFRAYAKHTPIRKSPEELQRIAENDNLLMYRDKNMSVAYTEKEVEVEIEPGRYEMQTQRQVHWTGAGDSNLVTPTVAPVTFNNGSKELPPELIKDITARAETLAQQATGITDLRQASDSDKMAYNQVRNTYFQNEIKNQQERIVKLRVELGSNNAYIPTVPKNYVPIPSTIQNKVQQSVGTIVGLSEQKQALLGEMATYNNDRGQIQIETGNIETLYGQLNS